MCFLPRMFNVTFSHCLLLLLVQFEPFIHEPASPHVHHILIYECSAAVDLSSLTDDQLRGGPCYTDPSVFNLTMCMLTGSVVAAWAVGGEVSVLYTPIYHFSLPQHAYIGRRTSLNVFRFHILYSVTALYFLHKTLDSTILSFSHMQHNSPPS